MNYYARIEYFCQYNSEGIYYKIPAYYSTKKWFKWQLYFPTHKLADDLGYLHFKSKKCLNDFKGKYLKG